MLTVHLGFHPLFLLLIHFNTTMLPFRKQIMPKKKKVLYFLTSTEVLNIFAVCFQTGPQLSGLFSDLG